MIGLYAKAVVAAAITALTTAQTALNDDGHITNIEWIAVAVSFVVALGAVRAIPNLPSGVARYGKAITAGIVAGLGSVAAALTDGGGITTQEWVAVVLAIVAAAVPTWIAPNARVSELLPRR